MRTGVHNPRKAETGVAENLTEKIAELETELARTREELERERELRRRELIVSPALDHTDLGVIVVDENGLFRDANQAFCRICGFTPEELHGRSLFKLLPLDDRRLSALAFRDFMFSGQGQGRIICTIVRKDGQLVLARVTGTRRSEQDGGHTVVATVMDVTEQERFKGEARLIEARFEALNELRHLPRTNLQELSRFALEKGVALTKSDMGFIHFMGPDGENREYTIRMFSEEADRQCSLAKDLLHAPLDSAGLWAEAARIKKPIITSDYKSTTLPRKGAAPGPYPHQAA